MLRALLALTTPIAMVVGFAGCDAPECVACPAPGPDGGGDTAALGSLPGHVDGGVDPPIEADPGPGGGGGSDSGVAAVIGPQHFGCPVFPSDNPWNQDVSDAPVDSSSGTYLWHMNADTEFLHAYFGADPRYGIPVTGVPGSQPRVPIRFSYAAESDPGPYPIPSNVAIEGGASSTGDRHVVVVDWDRCLLYELFAAYPDGAGWRASSGAVFHLTTDAKRPEGWTSADGAGLPILAGLVRYDEIQAGEIRHAIRFTTLSTRRGYVSPASHFASSLTDTTLPPMGLRVRLKASDDLSRFHGAALIILRAMKRYGMILADNGANWSFSGESDARWRDSDLNPLKTVPATAFEVVQHGPIRP